MADGLGRRFFRGGLASTGAGGGSARRLFRLYLQSATGMLAYAHSKRSNFMSDDSNLTRFNMAAIQVIQEVVLSYGGKEYKVDPTKTPFSIGRDESCNLPV